MLLIHESHGTTKDEVHYRTAWLEENCVFRSLIKWERLEEVEEYEVVDSYCVEMSRSTSKHENVIESYPLSHSTMCRSLSVIILAASFEAAAYCAGNDC